MVPFVLIYYDHKSGVVMISAKVDNALNELLHILGFLICLPLVNEKDETVDTIEVMAP